MFGNFTRFLKSVFVGVFLAVILAVSINFKVSADYQILKDQLKQVGVDIKDIESMKTVPRYYVAWLLNILNCYDCRRPPLEMKNFYSGKYWNKLKSLPGKNLGDIKYPKTLYSGHNFYYCVAYVADKGLMRGYPKGVSPICEGRFCGTRPINYAEFFQVLINFIGHYVYGDFKINRKKVYKWMKKEDNIDLNSEQRKLIEKKKEIEGNSNVFLANYDEFKIYLLYCNYNPDDKNCNLRKYLNLEKGWPLAEINVLQNYNIIDYDSFGIKDIGEFVPGKIVVSSLAAVVGYQKCKFNGDYDNDGVSNFEDNCPYTCNPRQSDIDGDGIGDVCDDDVDGDGIKNPIGIVDDNGNIQMGIRIKQNSSLDNCPTVKNLDQKFSRKYPKIGEKCAPNDYKTTYFSIKISPTRDPKTFLFSILTNSDEKFSDLENTKWYFSDGFTAKGQKVYHTFDRYGKYNINAVVKTLVGQKKLAASLAVSKKNYIFNPIVTKIPRKVGENLSVLLKSSLKTINSIQYGVDGLGHNVLNPTFPKNISLPIQNAGWNDINILFTENTQQFLNTLSLRIRQYNQCLILRNKNRLSDLKCDMDKDGIPDLCDNDIDGDGIKNFSNLVLFEYPDCHYDFRNVNIKLYNLEKTISCMDNSPFGGKFGISLGETKNGDRDGDGIPDDKDLCPTVPEDYDGFRDEDGCPEKNITDGDRDGDGIPDDKDYCPYVVENYNGVEDNDGCPETNSPNCNLNGICEPDKGEDCGCGDCDCGVDIQCNSCPCPSAQRANIPLFIPIRAKLYSLDKKIIYSISLPLKLVFPK